MNVVPIASACLLVFSGAGCVTQHVSDSVDEHAAIEGERYASEVTAQSPFKTMELSWREAEELMKVRNPNYRAAQAGYTKAVAETPLVEELADQVKEIVDLSMGDVLKPDKLAQSLQLPITQIPKQLKSISKIKDISHEIEQSTWEKTEDSVSAEFKMRREQVKLHKLLRMGELIDNETAALAASPPLPAESDPKLVAARQAWGKNLSKERDAWLDEVRDLFDAEYYDVHFVKDHSGLPTYESIDEPDMTEWNRWCHLSRSQELVGVLQEAHKNSKPALPGTRMVTGKIAELFNGDDDEPDQVLKASSVRSEVRTLLRSWREMKEAQEEAERLEASNGSDDIDSIPRVGTRQQIFKFRQQEIQFASIVWLMDEECWH